MVFQSRSFINFMIKRIAVTIMLVFSAAAVNASGLGFARQDGGKAGAFLSFGAGARALGMGKTFVGVADDASAVYWNPAGLVQLTEKELTLLYASLYEQTGYSFVSYAHPLSFGAVGAAVVNLNSGGFALRDEYNYELGEASLSETAAIVSYAKTIINDETGAIGEVSAGVNIKAVQQSLNAVTGTGFGADLGAYWSPRFISGLYAGLSLKNVVAPRLKLADETDTYPLSAVLGAAYLCMNDALLLAVDVDKTDGREYKLHLGGEYTIMEAFHLRAGLDETELAAGFGFDWSGYSIDYTFAWHDAWDEYENLGISHRFGLTARF